VQERGRHFRRTRRFPPAKRFAELPAFGLLGALPAFGLLTALGLTVLTKVFMPFPSLPEPTGFYVELVPARCEEYDVVDRVIVLHITDTGKLLLNQEQEDWTGLLAGRLSQIYSMRKDRTLYLLADSGVPFQTVAHALDIVEDAPVAVKVRLVTPKALNADCPKFVVVTGSGHHVIR